MEHSCRDKAVYALLTLAACLGMVMLIIGGAARKASVENAVLMLAGGLLFMLSCAGALMVQRRRYRKEAMRLSQDNEELRRQAIHDGFTGLYNKKHTQQIISQCLSRFSNEPRALFMLDIDCLKQINDCYGHQAGDDAILTLSRILQAVVPESSIMGLIGGDEFMVLIHVDQAQAEALAKEVVDKLNMKKTADEPWLRASIGFVMIPSEGEDFQSAYKRVDQAMYRVKARGGNGWDTDTGWR